VRVWDATSGAQLACLQGHTAWVASVAWSPDGRRLATGAGDQTVRVWDATSGAQLACLQGHTGTVASVAWSPDGRRLASGAKDRTVRVWDATSGAQLACLQGHTSNVESMAWSPDGRRLASGADDRTVRVWDAEGGECLEVIPGRSDVAVIAAGPPSFPWRALSQGDETAIERASGAEPVAWFPAYLNRNTTHPSGRIWAGSVDKHLYIIQLEGEPKAE
jgi:WD40 repeat protein